MFEDFLSIFVIVLIFLGIACLLTISGFGSGVHLKAIPLRRLAAEATLALAAALVLPAVANAQNAYITNFLDDTVSVIDTATNIVITSIPVGDQPAGVAVTEDGTKAYVANQGRSSTISVIETSTNTVVKTIPVGAFPISVAVTGNKAFVTNSLSNSVSVIDTATDTVTATIPVGIEPRGVAVTPDGTKAYVTITNTGTSSIPGVGTVAVIDTATNTVATNIPIGVSTNPLGVAVTPDGTKVYVANENSDIVSVISTETDTIAATISVGGNPVWLAVAPDGTKLYVTKSGFDNVLVIDVTTNTVIGSPIPVGDQPEGIAVTSDGTRAYVANSAENTVSVIDTATSVVTATILVGAYPAALGRFIGGPKSGLPPVAVNETATTNAGAPVTIDLAAGAKNNPTSAALVGSPVGGTVSGFPATKVTFTPASGFTGQASFQFTLANAFGTSNTATATINVIGLAPVISSVSPNPVTGSASSQPFTIDGANFVIGANVTLRDLTTGEVFPNRTVSSFTSTQIVLDPIFTTAAHDWSVEVINPDGQSSGPFAFQVIAPPSGLVPVAVDQTVPATAGKPKTINLALGATGNPTSATILDKPSHGGYALSGTQVTYTPDICYSGPDSFTFTLSNAYGASNIAKMTIDVAPAKGSTVTSTTVHLVDPFLLGGDLSNIDLTSLYQTKKWDDVRADGLVADNTSAAIAIFETNDGTNPITLSTTNGTTLLPFRPDFLTTSPTPGDESLAIEVPKLCQIGGTYFAAALVQAPIGATAPSYTHKIVVTARQGGKTTTSPEIELVPPPVVLVHGIWSDNNTLWTIDLFLQNVPPWDKHRDLIASLCYSKYLAFDAERDPATKQVADFLSNSSINPCEQTSRDAISSTVYELLTILDRQHIVGSRVDVVAHSMGGLAARWAASQDKYKEGAYRYLRNRGKGEIHKAITLDTPELGSELARFLVNHSQCEFVRDVTVPLAELPKPFEYLIYIANPPLETLLKFIKNKKVCSKGQTVAQCFASDPPNLPIAARNAPASSGAVYSLIPGGASLSNPKLAPPNIPDVDWYAIGSVAPDNSKLAWLLNNFIAGISPSACAGTPAQTVNSILGFPLVSNDAVVNGPSQVAGAQANRSRTFPDLSHTQLPILLKIVKPTLRDANVAESDDVHYLIACRLSGTCGVDPPPPATRPSPPVAVVFGAREAPCAFRAGLKFHAHRSPVTGVRLDLANPRLRLHPWADGPTIPGPANLDLGFVSYRVVPAVGLPVVTLDPNTGILTGLQPGTATIIGQCGSQTDTVIVEVGSEQPMPAN